VFPRGLRPNAFYINGYVGRTPPLKGTDALAIFLRHHPMRGAEGGRPMQIWLILAMVGSAPIHVGNFPDLDSCQAAAMSSRGQVTGARPGSMSYLWMCVQANTGKPNDPPPP
jgi:hypothetical protein